MEEKELTEFEWEMRELQQLVDSENYVPCISSTALMDHEFTPAEFVVKEWLPKGLCILGGAPKVGKSWLVLDLCLHVAKGEPFLGMEVKHKVVMVLITQLAQGRRICGADGRKGQADQGNCCRAGAAAVGQVPKCPVPGSRHKPTQTRSRPGSQIRQQNRTRW